MAVPHFGSKLLVLSMALALSACAKKTSNSVFTENSDDPKPNALSACNAERIPTQFLVEWENGAVTQHEAENAEVFTREFIEKNLDLIKYVEFNKKVRLSNEDNLQTQGSIADLQTLASASWGQTAIEASNAWSQNIKGSGVKVAVIDSAVDYEHLQIKPRLSQNLAEINGVDGVDDDNNGYIDDKYGWDFFGDQAEPTVIPQVDHGTHVAGVIVADHSTGGLKGVAPLAELIPANFMNAEGSGDFGSAIRAIRYVAARGAKVINASWGGDACSQTLRSVIKQYQNQLLFVSAAGNEGADLEFKPEFPAAFDLANQLTIAAHRSDLYLAGFSNFSLKYVQLGAPGDSIVSTVRGGYAEMSGTSMAAPFVSGAAALLWSAKPTATVQEVRQALINSVIVQDYKVMTRGRLNVRRALEAIRQLVP